MVGHAMYVHRYAKNDHFPLDFAIFTKALWTDQQTDRPMDGPTDGRTDQRTDKPSYGDAIAATKGHFALPH